MQPDRVLYGHQVEEDQGEELQNNDVAHDDGGRRGVPPIRHYRYDEVGVEGREDGEEGEQGSAKEGVHRLN